MGERIDRGILIHQLTPGADRPTDIGYPTACSGLKKLASAETVIDGRIVPLQVHRWTEQPIAGVEVVTSSSVKRVLVWAKQSAGRPIPASFVESGIDAALSERNTGVAAIDATQASIGADEPMRSDSVINAEIRVVEVASVRVRVKAGPDAPASNGANQLGHGDLFAILPQALGLAEQVGGIAASSFLEVNDCETQVGRR